jgi:hypothetical protein
VNEVMEKGSLGEVATSDLWHLGFAEFPERFRIVWSRLDERLALIREQEAFHAAEVRSLDTVLAGKRREIDGLVLQVREGLRPELDALLHTSGEARSNRLGESALHLLTLEKLYAVACTLPIPGRLVRLALSWLPHRRRPEATAKEFFDRCLALTSLYLDAPQPAATCPLADLKSTACTRLYEACRRLYQDLLEGHVAAELPRRPEQEQILTLQSEMARIEVERKQIESPFADTAAARSRLRERHAAARQAVLEVGREIANGRRTAGQGAPLALCATCSALMPAGASSCFSCGIPLRSTSELQVPFPESPVSA